MRITKRRVASAVLLFIGLMVLRYFTVPGARLVFGRVVNPVTGESVRGVNVALVESHYDGWAVHTEAVRETYTNRFGWFILLPAFRWMPGGPLSNFGNYWLTVNEAGEDYSGGEEGSAQGMVLYNPMFNRGGWAIGNGQYFPKTITFRLRGCDRIWDATCSYRLFGWGAVPLVPVLNNTEDCRKIFSSSLREQCRQLNTYHSAFVHIDSYGQVQQDKQLCSQVDHGIISAACLQELPTYIAMAYMYNPQLHARAVLEPIPQGMFPDSLAGLPVMSNKHCDPRGIFDGRVMCSAGYGASLSNEQVAIYIETFPGTHENFEAFEWHPTYTDHKQATVTDEVRLGSKILYYHGSMYDSYLWYNGEKHVEVFFYHHIPEESQFVSYYLQRFPSTLQ